VDFDLKTGQVPGRCTIHGLDDHSYWSRGHAWGVYGFSLEARRTGDPRFVAAVRCMSEYYLARSPDDHVAYWDFEDPAIPSAVRDSSAAAITCAAWLCHCTHILSLQKYRVTGMQLLDVLCNHYLQPDGQEGLLAHGCAYKKRGVGVGESMIWGDYYFVQALLSAQEKGHRSCSRSPKIFVKEV